MIVALYRRRKSLAWAACFDCIGWDKERFDREEETKGKVVVKVRGKKGRNKT